MEAESEDRALRTSPSVTKEKWFKHAVRKLAAGYDLILNKERGNANFFKPGKGFEMCAYSTAKELVRAGVVVEARTTYRGVHYELADVSVLQEDRPPEPHRAEEEEPEEDDLLDQLESELDDADSLDVDEDPEI